MEINEVTGKIVDSAMKVHSVRSITSRVTPRSSASSAVRTIYRLPVGKLDESSYWFELLEETGTVASANIEPLQKECNELLAIFTTIAKKCKAA